MTRQNSNRLYLAAVVGTVGLLGVAAIADDKPKIGGAPTPQMQAVLDEIDAQHGTPVTDLGAKDARKQPNAATAAVAILKKQGKDPATADAVQKEDNIKIPGPVEKLDARVYTPGNTETNGPLPVIVYYHGGGFVLATIDTYESSARALANQSKAIVVSVEYRKAPEYKWPAAHDDAWAAYQWVTQHAGDFNGDPKKVAVAGESAGGNLAAAVSQKAKEQNAQLPVFQLLIYPWVDNDMKRESYVTNAMAKPLSAAMMTWFTQNYLDNGQVLNDPHLFPFKSTSLSGLPPAMVITAAIDPLQSEGYAYAMKLKEAGVAVEYKNYEGVTHEFFGLGGVVDVAKQAETDAGQALQRAFQMSQKM
ncbi:MAG: nlhH [Phycisphaerales bacterium]|nr:nlhH [Phycisphaerales bacterium]